MSDEITIRAASADEAETVRAHLGLVFGFDPVPERVENFRRWIEWDRSIVGDSGSSLVATGATNSYRMNVPGGDLAAGGLTIVTVSPTHRRRGLLRRIMRTHLEDVRAHGEPLAILFASEATIYGRFGFGSAMTRSEAELPRAHAAFREDVPPSRGSLRLVTAEAAAPMVRALWPRTTAGVPGEVHPREADLVDLMRDFPDDREGATAYRYVVYDRDGEPQGFARYRQKEAWTDSGPNSTLIVREVHAADGEAFAALWRFLLEIDLVAKIEIYPHPVPSPLRHLLRDPRRLVQKTFDGVWVRVVDVPAALAGRRYRVAGSLVLEVHDGFFDSGGRFRLEGGPDGATCVPTTDAPDLTLDIERLGAIYLGGTSVRGLAWLGLITGDAAAVNLADAMFSWPVPPANSLHF